jgi:hypothetical protein
MKCPIFFFLNEYFQAIISYINHWLYLYRVSSLCNVQNIYCAILVRMIRIEIQVDLTFVRAMVFEVSFFFFFLISNVIYIKKAQYASKYTRKAQSASEFT